METNGTRLRLLWSDIHGIERGKYLYGNWSERGRANFCLATFPLTFDREILPIEGLAFDVGLPDLEATIEPDSLRTGWEPKTTVGIGRLSRQDGPLAVDPRHLLEQAVASWIARGLTPQIAFEFEFYLLRPGGDDGWLPLSTPGSRVYGTGMAVDPLPSMHPSGEMWVNLGHPVSPDKMVMAVGAPGNVFSDRGMRWDNSGKNGLYAPIRWSNQA